MAQSRNQFFITTAIFLLLVSIALAAVVVNSGVTSPSKSESAPTATPSTIPTPTATQNPSTTETPAPTNTSLPSSSPTATPTPTAYPTETLVPASNVNPAPDLLLKIFSDTFSAGNMGVWTLTDVSIVDFGDEVTTQTHVSPEHSSTPPIGALLLLAIPVIVFKIHRKGIG